MALIYDENERMLRGIVLLDDIYKKSPSGVIYGDALKQYMDSEQFRQRLLHRTLSGCFKNDIVAGSKSIDLLSVSHSVQKLWLGGANGNTLIADILVLKTPKGQILDQLLQDKIGLSFALVTDYSLPVNRDFTVNLMAIIQTMVTDVIHPFENQIKVD